MAIVIIQKEKVSKTGNEVYREIDNRKLKIVNFLVPCFPDTHYLIT